MSDRMYKAQARYGNGSGVGRRLPDEFASVAKRSHDRQFDPEARRQRRLGSYMTGGAALAAAGLATGGRGVARTTRALRGITSNYVAARPRDLTALGVGAASAAGTGGLHNYANDPKRRRYS